MCGALALEKNVEIDAVHEAGFEILLKKNQFLENVENLALAFAQFDVTQTESIDKLGCLQKNLSNLFPTVSALKCPKAITFKTNFVFVFINDKLLGQIIPSKLLNFWSKFWLTS